MLVLSRKLNQKIVIDGNITIEVLKVKGNTVRLGISAPKEVHIARGELKPRDEEFVSEFHEDEPSQAEVAAQISDSSEPTGFANMTIIIANEGEDEKEINIVPFIDAKSSMQQSNNRIANLNQDNGESTTIQFRGKLPTTLHRNRLAEIASELSNKKN